MSDHSALTPGVALGDFTLEQKLAAGGMAEVWRARGPDGALALKVLRPEHVGDPNFVAMFHEEVRISAGLRHPNIIRVFGAHEARGFVFQSMELLEGLDLRRLLSHLAKGRTRLPLGPAFFIARELAKALEHAHSRCAQDGRPMDIVHRDVSPHNIMLCSSGRVKLLDFGVARAAQRAVETMVGVIKGKLAYMAPEQALAVGVSAQTDVFAAGIVLWETLAMERLFKGESNVLLLEKVVEADVPDVRTRNADVPEDAARLVSRMLAKRAPDRPASMAEVEAALNRLIAEHCTDETCTEAGFADWLKANGPRLVRKTLLDQNVSAAPESAGADSSRDPTLDDAPKAQRSTEPNPVPLDAEGAELSAEPARRDRSGSSVGQDDTHPDRAEERADDTYPDRAGEGADDTHLEGAEEGADDTYPEGAEEGADDTAGLVAPDLPQAVGRGEDIDVARTWLDTAPPPELVAMSASLANQAQSAGEGAEPVDEPVTNRSLAEDETPFPDDTSEPPKRAVDRVRMPTRTEVIRAVENQATVEMQAHPDVADLAAALHKPTVETRAAGDALPAPSATELELEPPEAHERGEAPTALGLLASPERPSLDEPARSEPGAVPDRSAARFLPILTLALAIVVLVLVFLLLRGG